MANTDILANSEARIVAESAQNQVLLERKYGKTIADHVRQFGLLWLVVGLLGIGYFGYKGSGVGATVCGVAGTIIFVLSRIAPIALVPLWRGWMAIGVYLGMVVTPILLTIVWFLVVMPIALILRVMGTEVLMLRFRENIPSYWEERKEKGFSPMTRQF